MTFYVFCVSNNYIFDVQMLDKRLIARNNGCMQH